MHDPTNLPWLKELTLAVDDWDDENASRENFCSVLGVVERRVQAAVDRNKTVSRSGHRELFGMLSVSQALVPKEDRSHLQRLVRDFSFAP